MLGDVKLLMEHISFQAYIEVFNKIEEVNIAALVVSSITIIVLAINNEFLKVSAKGVSLFMCMNQGSNQHCGPFWFHKEDS
jgi:hypothetical protein